MRNINEYRAHKFLSELETTLIAQGTAAPERFLVEAASGLRVATRFEKTSKELWVMRRGNPLYLLKIRWTSDHEKYATITGELVDPKHDTYLLADIEPQRIRLANNIREYASKEMQNW